MAKLEKLRTALQKAQNATGKVLNIVNSTFPGELAEVQGFFTEVLSATTLDIQQINEKKPLLVTSVPNQITVQGRAAVFGSQSVALILVFTEDTNGKLGFSMEAVFDSGISIGNWMGSLNAFKNELQPKLGSGTIKSLSADYEPGVKTTFSFGADIEVAGKNFPSKVTLRLTKQGDGSYDKAFDGVVTIANTAFKFSLLKENKAWKMEGGLDENGKLFPIDFVAQFQEGFTLPEGIPTFDIDTAKFTYDLQTKEFTFKSGSSNGLTIVDSFGINNLGFSIVRKPGAKPNDKAIVTIGLTGTLQAAGLELGLQATLEAQVRGSGKPLKFETLNPTGKDIDIQTLIDSLKDHFENIELPGSIAGSTISDIRATYVKDAELTFSFVTLMEAGGKDVRANIDLRMTRQTDGSYEKSFEGLLLIGEEDPLEFELVLTQDGEAANLYATLRPGDLGRLSLSDLFKKVVNVPDDLIPEVELSLVGAFVNITKMQVESNGKGNTKAKANLFLGVEVGVDMVFGDGLPLVGPLLNGQSIGVKTVLFSYSTVSVRLGDLKKINLSLPKGKPQLPEIDMKGGIGLSFSVSFGKVKQYISLPTAEQEDAMPEAPPPLLTKPEREGKWFTVNKRLGPLSIVKVGVNFKNSVLTLGLEATLALGPLTLQLEEFTMGSSIKKFSPVFSLHGFGIGYTAGPVEISGMFIHKPANDEYVGAALIKTPQVTLKAIGAFAMVQGEPSFYLYAYLGYPIGGPAFFFVEGLAAGFGFNRSVTMPAITEVNRFPLVAIAIGTESFLDVASRMADGGYVPIDPGKLFLAVGVRFTTFKQLDSFLLIIASFGKGFRLDLLGLSKLTVPSAGPQVQNKTPLAEVELAIKGTFAPDEGFIGVQAQLTKNSYILSRDCYLTGGFAFFTWFEPSDYAGDFVISLGGYHPQFVRPAHYPVVPRLGFNWQVSSEINVKGQMYFALTPSVLMAGGRLEATFQSGGLKAWFIIGADFIIGWKPFFYDARMYVNIGASYTFWFFGKQTVSMDIGADLHIWGPEFSGTAYVDLGVIDFTIGFGAGASQTPRPIRYEEFEKSFLPASNVTTVTVQSGLLKEVNYDGKDIWVINPKEFVLSTDSAVPSNAVEGFRELQFGKYAVWMRADAELFNWLKDTNTKMTDEVKPSIPFAGVTSKDQLKVVEVKPEEKIGIGMVGVKTNELVATQTVNITKGNDDFTAGFVYEPATKSYPAALWGQQLLPDKNDKERVITGLLSGYVIKPKPPADPDQMGFLDQEKFKFQTLPIQNAFTMERAGRFTKKTEALTVTKNSMRDNILAALGYTNDDDFELDENTDFAFAEDPLVGRYFMVSEESF